MKRTLALSAALALGMAGSSAVAAPRATYKWTDPSLQGTEYKAPNAAAVSHVIYLNDCKPNGCSLHAGYDNATTDTSSIPNSNATVSPYSGSATNWTALVNCVKQTYADFDVEIVTTRPTSGNYHMAIVAGQPTQVGMQNGVLGVSPFSCGYISNSISFTFANVVPNDVPELCWTVAQETAHSWGLDHKYDNRDPMTYLSGGPNIKSFQNEAGSCGEYSARTCSCTYAGTGNAKMNSYALIMATFGSNTPDTVAPTVNITYPTEGAQITAGFPVRADINDDRTVDHAEFRLDGQLVKTLTEAPWNWSAPTTLGQGAHKVEITAYDRGGNTAKQTVNVQNGTVCMAATDCTTAGQVCVDGHCVAGPGMPGGLGSPCTMSTDCASNQCGSDADGNSYCVEACDPSMNACPSGFDCQDAGNGAGVCWPGGGDDGGCSTNTSSSGGAGLLLLGMAAMFITRRRRK
ncbi:MAG TPA: Ig-like domain-containing protein [Kofleriaceae bacterium]|nr:Ig-like domain-containing protein [Kofleriaceae bacterium]